jgi:uncharacterized membrane protein
MKRLAWVMAAVLLSAAFHVLTVKAYPYYIMLKLARHAHGALNTIRHDPRVSAQSRNVVRPSPDLLYSACGYNVSKWPLRVHAVIPKDTYWSVSMFAANTDNFFVMNDRKAGAPQVDLVLVRAGQEYKSTGNEIIVKSPTRRGVILFRLLINDESRLNDLLQVQKQASCTSIP